MDVSIVCNVLINEGVIIKKEAQIMDKVQIGKCANVGSAVNLDEKVQLGQFTCVENDAAVVSKTRVPDRCMITSEGKIRKPPSADNMRWALNDAGRCVEQPLVFVLFAHLLKI